MKGRCGRKYRWGVAATAVVIGILVLGAVPDLLMAGQPQKALILLSLRIRPYEALAEEMIDEFEGYQTKVVYLDEDPRAPSRIPKMKPSVIVTVGQEAVRTSIPYRDGIPLVYTMVLFPNQVLPEARKGISGIAMIPSPEKQLRILKEGFNLRRIGLIYNPDLTGFLVEHFESHCPAGMECEAISVRSEGELLKRLKSGLGGIDGLLLIPDPTVLTEQGIKTIISTCYEEKIPLIGFSPMYLSLGAAFTLSVPEHVIARQAAGIATNTNGKEADLMGNLYYPKSCEIHINPKAAERLGFDVDQEALEAFGVVKWGEQ